MDALHRILSWSPSNRRRLIAVALAFWFATDLVQFADWLHDKIRPPMTTMCLPLELMPPSRAIGVMPTMPQVPPHIDNFPFYVDR